MTRAQSAQPGQPVDLDGSRTRTLARNLQVRLRKLRAKGAHVSFHLLEVQGIVTSRTNAAWNAILTRIAPEAEALALELSRLEYLNSSGIGSILALADHFSLQTKSLGLVGVPPQILAPLTVLGVTATVPAYADLAAFVENLIERAGSGPVERPALRIRIQSPAEALATRTDPRIRESLSTLVLCPRLDLFVETLKRNLGQISICRVETDIALAEATIADSPPDAIILEDRMDPGDAFVFRLRRARGTHRIPVIRVYARGSDLEATPGFKVWESDSIVEPFDVRELFGLVRSELASRDDSREEVLQLTVSFSEEDQRRAEELGKAVIDRSGLSEKEAAKFCAAYREALDNAFKHGARFDRSRPVEVEFSVRQDRIAIAVTDPGGGFDHEQYVRLARTLDVVERARYARAEKKLGGLGIKLMLECSDRVTYSDDGRQITIEKDKRFS